MGEIWHTHQGKSLSADVADLQLVVEVAKEVGGLARFRVFLRVTASENHLIGSGVKADIREAMEAAERMARIHSVHHRKLH
jgi:hypothetical protein